MIGHMRHGSPPRLTALQSILSPNRRESLPAPSAGVRMSGPKVSTGHHNGVITIALAEADDAERESRRKAMGEPYRTLLGHLRHEVGHYFWERLVRDEGRLASFRATFRATFGDDRANY